MVTQNPLGKRVREILNTDWQLVQQEKFHPGVYFNDIQLRLLQWKFVVRILSEKQSWWTGTGAGQAQELLDQEYIDANMYLGDPATGDRGYREFNAHSQLFESLLRYGLPGVLLFGLVILSMLIILFYVKSTPFRIILLLLVAYSLVESVYETQYGILLFTFFPVFLYFQTANRLIKNND
jgi:O-antigen ligase